MLSLRARNCRTGDILDQEQRPAPKKEDVFNALAQMAKRFGTRVGESLARVENEPSLSAEVTTSSLEAWRSYSAAMKAFQRRAQSAEIISLLKRAIEIDPKFPIAYAQLGRLYDDLGEPETGAQNIAKAYELRASVSDLENYFITFSYHRQVTRNLELARQTLESWEQKYPGDICRTDFCRASPPRGTGHHDQTAVEEGQKAIELDPNFAIGYENVAWAYIYLNRLSKAEAVLRRHLSVRSKSFSSRYAGIYRFPEEQQGGDGTGGDPTTGKIGRPRMVRAPGSHDPGVSRAPEGSKSVVGASGKLGLPGRFAGAGRPVSGCSGGLECIVREPRRRDKRTLRQRLSLYRGRDADYGPAFALALLQDSSQAHKIAAELENSYLQDTSVQFSYLPTLRALQAINQGNPAKALEMTQAAAPYDFAVPGTAYYAGASSSEVSIQFTYVVWLIPGWAATAMRRRSFKRFSIIQGSC